MDDKSRGVNLMERNRFQQLCYIVLALILGFNVAVSTAAEFTATWKKMRDAPLRPQGPGFGVWIDLIYDTDYHKSALMMGVSGAYMNDVYHYDTAMDAWTEIEPFVPCNQILDFVPPYPRDEQSVEYDPLNRLYWSIGGSGYKCRSSYPDRTAAPGTTSTTLVDPTLTQLGVVSFKDWTVDVNSRLAYVKDYNPTTGTLTLATPISTLTSGTSYKIYTQRGGGTWYYSPASKSWGSFEGPHWGYQDQQPTNRYAAAFASSPKNKAILMFGGGPTNYGDTWVLDTQTRTWLQMHPDHDLLSPPGRME